MESLTYIEIDIPFCALTYGVAPCTASIALTGPIKCFNSIKTCQDRVHFSETTVTLRFAKPTDYLPREIDAIPSILDVNFTPATISLGVNLGTRATLSVKFGDHPHSDTGQGYDKYLADRDYDPYRQGTYWGKFRARQPFVRGRAIRWITGAVGESLAEMETRHFIIDSFDASADGTYTLIAKDILKLADGDRSVAPLLSNGFLVADISAVATSATLSPAGIGNAEYPSAGMVAIGGKEIVAFTRAGDVLTLTRAQRNTVATSHSAQDRAQLLLQFSGADPANILSQLFTVYAGVPSYYINLPEWLAETSAFLGTVFTGDVCEPTSVATLASELIEQACLSVWWDDIAQQIRLKVLRGIVTDADRFTPDNTLEGTLTLKEQPEKRISQVLVYFGAINPLRPLSDADNFRSSSLVVDEDAEEDYGSAAIKSIKSRWIPGLGRSIADRLGKIQIARYRDPPRRLQFSVMRNAGSDVSLGGGYRVESFCVQDATGATADVPIQVTRLNPGPDKLAVEAEEVLFTVPEDDLTDRLVIVDADNYSLNLRSAHDSIYPPPQSGDVVTCRINAGVVVGSFSTSTPAFDVGSWPAGVTLTLVINGRIQGRGGDGTAKPENSGRPGGRALYARYPVNVEMGAGQIWGGGGGGPPYLSLFGGGGGAGKDPGLGASSFGGAGQNGSLSSGGLNGAGVTSGGAPGQPGVSTGGFSPAFGGAAGAAIDGVSFITVTVGPGDIRGPQIN